MALSIWMWSGTLDEIEKGALISAIKRNPNKSKLFKQLGISRDTLYRKLRKYDIFPN